MMDLCYQLLILTFGGLCVLFSYFKFKTLVNPVFLLFFTFFLPSVIATFRLSGLQNDEWEFETYFLLYIAFFAWLIIPSFVLLFTKQNNSQLIRRNIFENLSFVRFKRATYFLLCFVTFIFFLSNFLQAGVLIPLFDPEIANEIHHRYPQIIGVFARFYPLVSLLLFLCYFKDQKKIHLWFIAFCLLVPFSRLARVDLVISLIGLLFLNNYLKVIQLSLLRSTLAISFAVFSFIFLMEMGLSRINRFGIYDISYLNVIDWTGSRYSPEWIVLAYAYFPLSFENLNNFVVQVKDHTYGLAVFEWFFIGFLKLNLFFPEIQEWIHIRKLYDPVSTGATVPTGLASFYLDFGTFFAGLPILIYSFYYYYLYFNKKNNVFMLITFCLASSALSLFCFQSFITHPNLYWQIFFCWIVYSYAKRRKQ